MEGTRETNLLIQPLAAKDIVCTETPLSGGVKTTEDKANDTEDEIILLDSSLEESQSEEVKVTSGDSVIRKQSSNDHIIGTESEIINLKETTVEVSKTINIETAIACQSSKVTDKVIDLLQMERTSESNALIQSQARKDDDFTTEKPQSEVIKSTKCKASDTEVEIILLDSSLEETQSKIVKVADGAAFQPQTSNNDVVETKVEIINIKEGTTSEISKLIKVQPTKYKNLNRSYVGRNDIGKNEVDFMLLESSADDDDDLTKARISDVEMINTEVETVLLDDSIDNEVLIELIEKRKTSSDDGDDLTKPRSTDIEIINTEVEVVFLDDSTDNEVLKRKTSSKEDDDLTKPRRIDIGINTEVETILLDDSTDNEVLIELVDRRETNRKKSPKCRKRRKRGDKIYLIQEKEKKIINNGNLACSSSLPLISYFKPDSRGIKRVQEAMPRSSQMEAKIAKIPVLPKIKLGVISANEDKWPLTRQHLTTIEEAVIEVMIESKNKSNKPEFLGKKLCVENFKSAWLYFICADHLTVNWMHSNLHKIIGKCQFHLRLVREKKFPRITKIKGSFLHSSTLSNEKILAIILAQNDNINTSKWKVLSRFVIGTQVQLVMNIDNASMRALVASRGNISYRFGEIKLELKFGKKYSRTGFKRKKSYTSVLNSVKQDNISWDSSSSRAIRSLKLDQISATGSETIRPAAVLPSKHCYSTAMCSGVGHDNSRPMVRSSTSDRSVPSTFGSAVVDRNREFATYNIWDCSKKRNIFELSYHNESVTPGMPVTRDSEHASIVCDSVRAMPTEHYMPSTVKTQIFTSNASSNQAFDNENITSSTLFSSTYFNNRYSNPLEPYRSVYEFSSVNLGASTSRGFGDVRSSEFDWPPPPPRWT